jgi:hypothetical protein
VDRVLRHALFGLVVVPFAIGIFATYVVVQNRGGQGGGGHVAAGIIYLLLLPSIMIIDYLPIAGCLSATPFSGIWIATILNMVIWCVPGWISLLLTRNRGADPDEPDA